MKGNARGVVSVLLEEMLLGMVRHYGHTMEEDTSRHKGHIEHVVKERCFWTWWGTTGVLWRRQFWTWSGTWSAASKLLEKMLLSIWCCKCPLGEVGSWHHNPSTQALQDLCNFTLSSLEADALAATSKALL